MNTRTLLLAIASVTLGAHAATAQDAPALRSHRITIAGGFSRFGGYGVGDNVAQLRTNAPFTTMPALTPLFRAQSSFDPAAGAEGRIGFTLTRALAVEVGAAYTRPRLGVVISADPEAEGQELEGERVEQYVIDVSVLWQVSRISLGRRARPYVTIGGGYLRQLHEGRVLVETGSVLHVGGGARYWLRGGDGTRRSLGLRAEGRLQFRSGGIDFEGKSRTYPTLHTFAFFAF